jgi:DNA-binding GntR family transcriptional regulator
MPRVISMQVFKEIEAAILAGQIKPRERLVEMDLISRFGGSRTVIREALKKLEAEGLIRTTPYRGAIVADLTVEEIEDLYFVRAAIEKLAARLVIKHIRTDEIKGLRRLSKEVESHLRRKTDQMIEKDLEFHQALFKTCRNPYLYEMIHYLKTKAHIVGYNAWSLPDRIEQSTEEHRQMIDALEAKNASQLEKLTVKHLTYSKKSYLAQLRGRRGRLGKSKERDLA